VRVLVAMSGGVDSSVAALLLRDAGHEVVGATMKLWGGLAGSGCCSVADVEDARRVCQQLGIAHHVFNFTSEFERDVVEPYVRAHAEARTPNPCISCNAHLKFDRFLERALVLGFDAMATGHHARVSSKLAPGGKVYQLRRGRDRAKDQSYVLYMLAQGQLSRLLLPVGELTKAEVRRLAGEAGLRTASKPDSQDVCFVPKLGGRESFLGERIPLGPGRLVSTSGAELGTVGALELVTVGQRRGVGPAPRTKPGRRYVLEVDLASRTATLGALEELMTNVVRVREARWCASPLPGGARVLAQLSAHGTPLPGTWHGPAGPGAALGEVVLDEPARRVAPGQAVVFYCPDEGGDAVLGGGTAF
jgi:tRNA-specific 2-thiouridylase